MQVDVHIHAASLRPYGRDGSSAASHALTVNFVALPAVANALSHGRLRPAPGATLATP